MAQVNNEYAKALFELALETGSIKEISSALGFVSATMKENPEYIDFLSSPNIPKAERIAAIEQAFTGSVPEYVISFLSVLCEKERIRSLEECILEYKRLCDAADKISVACVRSAVELSDGQKAALTKKLQKLCGRKVILNCTIDKALIGGVTVELDGKVIDGSIRHKLNELKEVMHK